MKLRDARPFKGYGAITMVSAVLIITAAFAADISSDSLKFADGVIKAKEGHETPATKYIVANATDIYSDHFIYGSKVLGHLQRGETVEARAKVKDYYDWILVGKNGVAVGYVPISLLAPADSYRP